MAGTAEGAKKAHQTLRQKLGEEGYSKSMAERGAKGGTAKVKKGFAITKLNLLRYQTERQEMRKKLDDLEDKGLLDRIEEGEHEDN